MQVQICPLCGRPVDPGPGAREWDGSWFCSDAHLWRWRWAQSPRRRAVFGRRGVVVLAAIVAGMVALTWKLDVAGTGAGSDTALVRAAEVVEHESVVSFKHPLVYRVHLDAKAMQVADAFVTAEFVAHDCKTMDSFSLSLPRTPETIGPIGSNCASYLETDRQNDAHLVRGSRVVRHNCEASDFFQGVLLKVNQCLRYAQEGRYITLDSGKRDYECDGAFFEVFLMNLDRRWLVVGEDDTLDWGGGCPARDVSFWKRREPWSHP